MEASSNIDRVRQIVSQAEQQCQTRGVRLTPKRKAVLSTLLRSETALSAYELADRLQHEAGTSMPAMSIYRILDFLEGERFAHKLNAANKYIACAHIGCGHEHEAPQFLICSQCQRVEEISVPEAVTEALQNTVDQAGFTLVSPQLELNCVCDKCNQTSDK